MIADRFFILGTLNVDLDEAVRSSNNQEDRKQMRGLAHTSNHTLWWLTQAPFLSGISVVKLASFGKRSASSNLEATQRACRALSEGESMAGRHYHFFHACLECSFPSLVSRLGTWGAKGSHSGCLSFGGHAAPALQEPRSRDIEKAETGLWLITLVSSTTATAAALTGPG
ncbi:hypothetical protein VTK26DRAFT_6642 [Humicola hyalothermophila]